MEIPGAREVAVEFFEEAAPFALAARFLPDLGGDHRHDADNLRLRCQPVWIEAVGGPGKVVVHAVKAEPEEMLSLLCGTPPVPAGRLVRAGDGWQARDGYNVAVQRPPMTTLSQRQ